MQFLKTLFWVLLTFLFLLFSVANWEASVSEGGRVIINLWGGLVVETRLPILLIVAFLLGFLPTLVIYGARIWSLRRLLNTQSGPASNTPPPIRNAPAPPEITPRSNA